MFRLLTISFLSLICSSAFAQPDNNLYKFCENENCEYGTKMGYRNTEGDTIIPLGKYYVCYTYKFINFAVVLTHDSRVIAIDKNGTELYEVYWFDGMPDNEFTENYGEGELFRIKINGLIGFANLEGEIVIKPQFECADYFRNGKCWVAKKCDLVPDGEHTVMKSDEGYYIDPQGNIVSEDN